MSKWIIEKSPVMECSVFDEELNFPLRNVYCVGRNYRDHAIEMGYFNVSPSFKIISEVF